MAVPGLCASWRDPRASLDATARVVDRRGTLFPLVLATLHGYHALFYSVSRADAVHHVCFALPLRRRARSGGALGNAQLFFIAASAACPTS